ncbi:MULTISPECIES: hypothetical protein [unclassified Cryobacterium]|uniref:hypothetical protein n=1 Tax=unclassified Cryobacterium TaxID=2649013 RepID=UPI002AB52E4C|nr:MULTISPECIES: hypothetical protein [unclassified Cryobacterium]MDY7528142.1 hypothetical protein [Cryobacterium sp. 10C2]MDY7556109.1 hypothetical protein [Cryobacterium sp. 10C3]MEB0292437.1 hypothetical protein [Cryobacterium sp. 10C2]
MDGNHEDFNILYQFPIGEDGLRRIRPNIIHIPRGYRSLLTAGRTLAVLGGANSIDIGNRILGRSYWNEESITEADLTGLGNVHADVMIGHDAPLHVPTLDTSLEATAHWWPHTGLAYAAAGRAMFHRGFLQVRPRIYLGGHYHLHIDELVDYAVGDEEFRTRIVILDQGGSATAFSQAILNVRSLHLQFFTRDGRLLST